MRRRQRIHVEDLAVGGQAAMEIRAIPGCYPGAVVARFLAWHVPAAGDLVGLAELVVAAAARRTARRRRHAGSPTRRIGVGIDSAAAAVASGSARAGCAESGAASGQPARLPIAIPGICRHCQQRDVAGTELATV